MTARRPSGAPEGGQFTGHTRAELRTRLVPRSLDAELDDVATRFGVDAQQVRRDHLISHVLAALSTLDTRSVVFFGGTALSRTHLADARLSEDIDLIAEGPRDAVARDIEQAIARSGIARTHGRPSWRPRLTQTSGSEPAVLSVPDGASIQVQLLPGDGYHWPTEVVELEQRYSDSGPARMRTLTVPAFAAAKLSAWIERRAPRDLYDLWALNESGLITREAADLFTRHGRFARLPDGWVFAQAPSVADWQRALGHQTILTVGPREAAEAVARAWDAVR